MMTEPQPKKQKCLEGPVGEQVVHAGAVGAQTAKPGDHVPELAHGRIGDHPFLMSVWVGGDGGPSIMVSAPTSATTVSGRGRQVIERGNRATMKTPAVTMVAAWIKAEIGVRSFHRIGEPDMQRTCADLPTAPVKSREADHRHDRHVPGAAEGAEQVCRVGRQLLRVGKDGDVIEEPKVTTRERARG